MRFFFFFSHPLTCIYRRLRRAEAQGWFLNQITCLSARDADSARPYLALVYLVTIFCTSTTCTNHAHTTHKEKLERGGALLIRDLIFLRPCENPLVC